jgi:PAS domain S-box-containing protein
MLEDSNDIVTRERQAQEALRQSAERLSLAMDAADLGDWVWDVATDMITLSERAAAIFGIPAGPFMTRTRMRDLLHEEDRERARLAAARAVAKHGDYNIEYRVPQPDNKVVWVAARGRGQYDAAGKITGMLGVIQDITERKRAEQRRDELLESERAARAEAERASRLKDDFLATVSHELRTPLNAILGYAQLLRIDPALSKDVVEGLEVIERNARAQAQIVDDILDMSRIINGKLRLEVQRVELRQVIEAALETVRTSAEAKGIRLLEFIDPMARPVGGDPARLRQVVWNLLSNSIKFTPRDGQVRVALRQAGSQVEVAVSDTGQGIEADFLPFVFDKFRQADASAARKHGGLGIGLALVKNLVEMHGGTVGVASDGPGRGATFVINLPVSAKYAEPDAERRQSAAQGLADRQNCPSLAGITVLAVEDEPDTRELLRRFLIECGANAVMAASAGEALDIIDRQRVDVVVSDIGMPEVDGYELVRLIRARPPDRGGNIPAAALTAFARSEDRTRALLAGYQTHIAKPVDPAELIAAIAALVHRTGR